MVGLASWSRGLARSEQQTHPAPPPGVTQALMERTEKYTVFITCSQNILQQ